MVVSTAGLGIQNYSGEGQQKFIRPTSCSVASRYIITVKCSYKPHHSLDMVSHICLKGSARFCLTTSIWNRGFSGTRKATQSVKINRDLLNPNINYRIYKRHTNASYHNSMEQRPSLSSHLFKHSRNSCHLRRRLSK
jgi:hypothetical protein